MSGNKWGMTGCEWVSFSVRLGLVSVVSAGQKWVVVVDFSDPIGCYESED